MKSSDEEFDKSLLKYPSHFDLNKDSLTSNKIKSVKNKLKEELRCGFELVEEEIRALNLLSFLHFQLGDKSKAFYYNSKALKRDKRNGIALANRARFNKYQSEFYDEGRDWEQLEKLYAADNESETIKALAEGEIAWSLTRFGPKFHEQALSKYESLLKDNPLVNETDLIIWKYDYGVCLHRTLHPYNKPEYPDRDSYQSLKKALYFLVDIAETSDIQSYEARALAEIGQIVFNAEQMPDTFKQEILSWIPAEISYESSKYYFDKALDLGRGDPVVMEKCARFYRYFRKYDLAIDLFDQALRTRQTSSAFHHLALALISKEESEVRKQINIENEWQPNLYDLTSNCNNQMKEPCKIEVTNLKRKLKCYRKVQPLVYNKTTDEAMRCLDVAIKLDEFNYPAIYDKALLLRKLGQTEKARALFCDLQKKLEIGELKISCYEQAGYCSLDLVRSSTKPERRIFDAIKCFQKAIRVAAALAIKVKYTSLDVRYLIPTVKCMLTTPELIETKDKNLQRLLQRLQDLLDRALPITAKVTSDEVKDVDSLIEKCLQQNQIDEAALLYILQEVASEENEDKFKDCLNGIVTAASTALSNGYQEAAILRYQTYFRLIEFRMKREQIEYDVFLMTDEEPGNLKSMEILTEYLTEFCGLRVINSLDPRFIAKPILNELESFSQKSTAVFVVLKEPKLDQMVNFFTNALISMPPTVRPKLAILKDSSVELPLAWANIPTILLPNMKAQHSNSAISWLSNLFKTIMNAQIDL